MKKILLLQMVLLSSLMATTGSESATEMNKVQACESAKMKARMSYQIFQMNSACRCEEIELKGWTCKVSFSYMGKKQ